MLNIKEICEIIPQRAPFLMIDRVEELESGKHAVAYKNVCINEWYFEGHFPGNPIMPGVLITEALAQTGAVAILSLEENKGKNALFAGIDKMKFKQMVIPGDVLRLEDLTVGMELEGTVRNVVDFGCFIDCGLHGDGLLHISKMTKGFIKHPSDMFSVGQLVKVYVYKVDLVKQKLQLTMFKNEE